MGRPPLLCQPCTTLLDLADIRERCPRCFAKADRRSCVRCVGNPSQLAAAAAALDYSGPAATLIEKLKQGGQPYHARLLASFMVVQWHRLGWPRPDLIVPVPQALSRRLQRGYNQSALLATEFGHFLSSPTAQPLRVSFDTIVLRCRAAMTGKTILLIDDIMANGSALRQCARALWPQQPAALYGLTACG